MLKKIPLCVFVVLAVGAFKVNAQQKVLSMKEAIQTAIDNYAAIKAKANQLNASKAYLKETRTEYLPDVNLSAQQDYGTINGQNGPLYGYRGLSVASSGPALSNQNWNAGFGALYLTNVNWDVFTFGRSKEKIKVQQSVVNRDETDLAQEQFQHKIRVASTYLNLLAAQRLTQSWQQNLNRALDLSRVVITRVKNGLNAGVDSSLANAEVSSARISLTRAVDAEQEQANLLSQYLGLPSQGFTLDSVFVSKAPTSIELSPAIKADEHPLLNYYRNRIGVSDEQGKYLRTFSYPTFSLFGVMQGRGSGFKSDINTNPGDYSSSYGAGVNPTRYNYLIGVGMIWNITSLPSVHYQVLSQKFTSLQLKDEYNLIDQRLQAQQQLAESKISNALKNYREAPVQVKSAGDAYLQKSTLYKNGLSNIVDFTQALYTLNRAETDRDIAYNNVWQALLYKAAATGDFSIFINNF